MSHFHCCCSLQEFDLNWTLGTQKHSSYTLELLKLKFMNAIDCQEKRFGAGKSRNREDRNICSSINNKN